MPGKKTCHVAQDFARLAWASPRSVRADELEVLIDGSWTFLPAGGAGPGLRHAECGSDVPAWRY